MMRYAPGKLPWVAARFAFAKTVGERWLRLFVILT